MLNICSGCPFKKKKKKKIQNGHHDATVLIKLQAEASHAGRGPLYSLCMSR
jgi:hypothetical protein